MIISTTKHGIPISDPPEIWIQVGAKTYKITGSDDEAEGIKIFPQQPGSVHMNTSIPGKHVLELR